MVTHAVCPQYGNLAFSRSPHIPQLFQHCNAAVVVIDDLCILEALQKATQEAAIMQAVKAWYHLMIFLESAEKQTAMLEKEAKDRTLTSCNYI
jgi:hypothetical protein